MYTLVSNMNVSCQTPLSERILDFKQTNILSWPSFQVNDALVVLYNYSNHSYS